MQENIRVSSVSSLVPKPLRDLIGSQKLSHAFEQDLIEFLRGEGGSWPIHLHTREGIRKVSWDDSMHLASKTEMDLVRGRVRVQKVAVNKNKPEDILRNLVHVGDHLVGDLESGRLLYLPDGSGWFAASALKEVASGGVPLSENTLQYEPEEDAVTDEVYSSVSYRPVLAKSSNGALLDESFPVMEAFEVSSAYLNDRKISYPKEQRSGYLKDLLLKVEGVPAEAVENHLTFRVTMLKDEATGLVRLKGASLWEGQWFDFGHDFFKHFEHLRFLRSSGLKGRIAKRILAEAALTLLSEPDLSEAEKHIELELAKLGIKDENARWEAEEYLRRFFKAFIISPSENLLASNNGWNLVSVDFRKFGYLFGEVQRIFQGDLFSWLENQAKDVLAHELFSQLRTLYTRLSQGGIELCYRDKPVRRSSLKVRIDTRKKEATDWFEIHPEISWEGRQLSDSEWRSILENRGIWDPGDNLWILDDASLKTLEVYRELVMARLGKKKAGPEPLRIPRLHFLDWMQLRQLGADVELSEENEAFMQKLLRFKKMESRELPDKFRGQLRDYQKEGYDWLAFLYEYGLGGCLADDMGLGKTVQAIAFLGGLREKKIVRKTASPGKTHLVVMPSTLIFNWKQEFQNFYPDMAVEEFIPSSKPSFHPGTEVLLTTYDLLRRYEAFFQKSAFHTVIFDEAQFMKNITAKRTASARRLRCEFVVTLTGTPLENHLGEYYSILDLSLPGLLGGYEDFKRWSHADPLERLKRRASPFVLRRTKENTLKELPAKSESEVYLRMSPKQKALYQKVVSQVKKDVDKVFSQKPVSQASLTALTAILRLRQVCVSPKILDPKNHERSPKIEYLISKLREIVDEDHSVLVFSQFTSFLDVVEEEVRAEKLMYFRMDGTTPKAKRKTLVDSFQCGAGAPIFLISLKTGGVGLNLTRASYVFHLDPWWNPAVENQASDRVHRIGQKKNVFVTRLVMEHSVEEKMMLLKTKKSQLYREVLDGAVPKSGRSGLLTKEDFDYLLGQGA